MKHKNHTALKPGEKSPLFVVGIGASAGGLEAMTELLRHLPEKTGMAFVYMQHLDPSHESMLAPILSRATSMRVEEVTNNMRIGPNRLYIVPPNRSMSVVKGMLKLTSRPKGVERFISIDNFFRSLADDKKNYSIGIVLSGNASDGAAGLKEIKSQGGITFAQDEVSAKYASMPQSAIAAHAADFIFSPKQIAKELVRISRYPTTATASLKGMALFSAESGSQAVLEKIFSLLQAATGVNFAHYKPPTIRRRIMRRMVLQKIGELPEYARYLAANPEEVSMLFQDMLINVTDFFRDPETFQFLKKEIFPALMKNRPKDEPVRIWIAGCSTGEETYSLAIALVEFLDNQKHNFPIQLFGTDLNEASIERARRGLYPKSIAAGVSRERLQRFFTEENGQYRISKTVRNMCIFAKQDITRDPPFSQLDLVSCRNVLIYFEPYAQKKIFPVFYYALKPSGFLMLGKSETIGVFSDLFRTEDKVHKLYRKNIGVARPAFTPFSIDRGHSQPNFTPAIKTKERSRELPKNDLSKVIDRALLSLARPPASIVVNESLDVIQFRGDLAPYLQFPSGKATWNLFKMMGEDIALEISAAVHEAQKKKKAVLWKHLPLQGDARLSKSIEIEVVLLEKSATLGRYFLVVFKSGSEAPDLKTQDRGRGKGKNLHKGGVDQHVGKLQRELGLVRQRLQGALEEQERANEEFQSANEEVLSSNEELQSINEELETAKEELQSTNEELTTVNDELQLRNIELNQANSDLQNLLNSANIPILILDSDLCIRRFTPIAQNIFHIIQSDIGRPIADMNFSLLFPGLRTILREVITTVESRSHEVQDEKGRWYSFWVRPYKNTDNKIDGVVITLMDIDEVKRAQAVLKDSLVYLEGVLATIQEPIIVLDKDFRGKHANKAFYKTFKVSPAEIENVSFFALGDGQWDIPQLRKLLGEIFLKQMEFKDFEIEHDFPRIGRRIMVLNGRRLVGKNHEEELVLMSIVDHTVRRLLAESKFREQRNDTFVSMASHELKTPVTTLKTLLQILEKRFEGSSDASLIDYLSRMSRQIDELTKIIYDLLDISRIKSGKFVLDEEIFDFDSLAGEIVENCRLLSKQHLIIIEGKTGARVQADRDRIGRVMINLIVNAIKYSPNATKIIVKIAKKEGSVVVSVRDFGIGIAEKNKEKVFDNLFQVDGKTFPGLGIGLYISRSIIERHGGRIWVESEDGAGSTFSFLLPGKGIGKQNHRAIKK